MRRNLLFAIILVALLCAAPLLAQTTVTEENLLRLIGSNAPEALIVKAISMAKSVEVDTSFENLPKLMQKGVSQPIITALVERKEQIGPVPAPAPAPAAPAGTSLVPEEAGVFIETATGLVPLQVETAKSKTDSPLGLIARGGGLIGGMKTQGVLKGSKSPVQVPGKVTVVIRGGADEYRLFPFKSKKNSREFTTLKGSFLKGASLDPDVIEGKFEKVAANVYKASFELAAGEYGFVAADSRKVYTFGIF